MRAWIVAVALLLTLTGCEKHIPSKVYAIETVDGEVINLYCPTVERGRSRLTYTIDQSCVLVED
jgi:hypothetical protein